MYNTRVRDHAFGPVVLPSLHRSNIQSDLIVTPLQALASEVTGTCGGLISVSACALMAERVKEVNTIGLRPITSQDTMTTTTTSVNKNEGIRRRRRVKTSAERSRLFRTREKVKEAQLIGCLNEVQGAIQDLIARQQLLEETHWNQRREIQRGHTTRIVVAYACYFERGFHKQEAFQQEQCDFLRRVMREEVHIGQMHGPMEVARQWECYSKYHQSIQFTLKSIEVLKDALPPKKKLKIKSGKFDDEEAPVVVKSYATLKVQYSMETFKHIFPHVLQDPCNQPLVHQLIGHEIEYEVTNNFYFDANGQIQRMEYEIGFIPALFRACEGNLQHVQTIMEDAVIIDESIIGERARALKEQTQKQKLALAYILD